MREKSQLTLDDPALDLPNGGVRLIIDLHSPPLQHSLTYIGMDTINYLNFSNKFRDLKN